MTHPPSESSLRTQIVQSVGASRETYWVLQGIVLIIFMASVVIGMERTGIGEAAALGPHQVLFRDQSFEVQRMDRELLSGLEDALRLRSSRNQWPSVDLLASEFVPPFVRGPGAGADYSWEFHKTSGTCNYLGRPKSGGGKPAFLLHLQEDVPHPGSTVLDEFHRKLDTGALLHVGVWFHPSPNPDPEAIGNPDRDGWKEIVLGAFVTPEK